MCWEKGDCFKASPSSYRLCPTLFVSLCPSLSYCPPPSFILPSYFPPAHFCCSRWYFFDTLSLFTVFFCLCYFINFFPCTQLPWFICVASVLKGLSFSSLLSVSFLSPTLVYAGILSRLLSCVERDRIAELWGGKEGRESEKKDRGMKAKVEGGGIEKADTGLDN